MMRRYLFPNGMLFAALALPLTAVGWSAVAPANTRKITGPSSAQSRATRAATYEMNAAAVVRRDEMYLSDFLSAGVPGWLRERATRIPLGDAPVAGAQRRIARAEIERDLRSFSDVRGALEIPEVVDVLRWSRPLEGGEALRSIADALRENHLSAQLKPEDVALNSLIYVTEASPRLKVTQIEPASGGNGMRVRMVVSSEPRIPAFWVLLDCEIDQLTPVAAKDLSLGALVLASDVNMEMRPAYFGSGLGQETTGDVVGRSTRRLIHAGETLRPEMLDPRILVRAGEPVEILVQGRGMRITAEATPLDAGVSGQKIRVRNQVTGKILNATVVGPRVVEIQF